MKDVEICRVAHKTLEANRSSISVLKVYIGFQNMRVVCLEMGKVGCRSGESESWSLYQTALLTGRVEEDRFRAMSRHSCGHSGNPLLKLSKYDSSFNRAVISGPEKGSSSSTGKEGKGLKNVQLRRLRLGAYSVLSLSIAAIGYGIRASGGVDKAHPIVLWLLAPLTLIFVLFVIVDSVYHTITKTDVSCIHCGEHRRMHSFRIAKECPNCGK